MKIIVNVIIGILIYKAFGNDTVSDGNILEEPFKIVLDNEELHPSVVTRLPNGYLCISTCIGDEQPSSSLYIMKDWKIEHEEREIEPIPFEHFDKIFRPIRTQYGQYITGVPKTLFKFFGYENV